MEKGEVTTYAGANIKRRTYKVTGTNTEERFPMITLINGLQYKQCEPIQMTVVGESACADSWGRALQDGKPAVSIPCYAERKFGGVQDNEMLIAFAPSYLRQIVEGLAALSKAVLQSGERDEALAILDVTAALAVLAGVNCLAVVALAWACCAVSGRGDGQGGEA